MMEISRTFIIHIRYR